MLGRASHSDEAMDQIGPLKSAMLWTVWNGLTKQRWGNRDRYLRLRYEDVMDEPRSSLIAVAEMVGIDPALLPFVADDKVVLSESHVLAGNPNRRDIGPVQFRADRRWESSLGRRERFTVTAVCAVMLRQMGYRWRVR
jgi:hypothetical protein